MKKTSSSALGLMPGVVTAGLGIFLAVGRNGALRTIITVMAIALLVIGTLGVLRQLQPHGARRVERVGGGILYVLLALLGIAMLIKPYFFNHLIKFILGAVILGYCIVLLVTAVNEKKSTAALIMPALGILLGLFIIIYRFRAENLQLLIAGIALAYTGVTYVIAELKR